MNLINLLELRLWLFTALPGMAEGLSLVAWNSLNWLLVVAPIRTLLAQIPDEAPTSFIGLSWAVTTLAVLAMARMYVDGRTDRKEAAALAVQLQQARLDDAKTAGDNTVRMAERVLEATHATATGLEGVKDALEALIDASDLEQRIAQLERNRRTNNKQVK